MKFGLYPRLALAGIRKNKRLYIPYLLTCTGMAMMYYIIIFLQHNEMLDGMRGGTTASTILALGGWVVAIFACIFLFYTHSFLLRRRKKEFGLYNILGMGRRHLVRIEIWETIFVAIGTTAAGLLCGIAFSKLAELGLMNLMHGSISYVFSISAPAIMATLLIFGVIHLLLLLRAAVAVGRTSATPMRCALYAMAAVVLCALFDKNDRFSFKHLKNAFCQAAIGSAQIVAACAASGIVIAMLSLTGLGLKFSNFILTLGGSNLVLCLVFSMLVSIILGMGLPTTAAYIITATTIAPSLLKLGLPPLCAHLFLFYFASLSCITPPVAIASYAGAALADANPSKVGWEAVRLGIVAFLIPYSFCLTPGVIMLDFSSFATGITGVLSALLTLLAALPIAWLMQGYTYRRVGILWRLLFAVCAVMLIIPDLIIEIPAAVIVLGIYYLHKRDYVKGRSIPA